MRFSTVLLLSVYVVQGSVEGPSWWEASRVSPPA